MFSFIYLNLLLWMSRRCLIVMLLFLQTWSNLLCSYFLCFLFLSFHFIFYAFVYFFRFFEDANDSQNLKRFYIKLRSSHLELSYFPWSVLKILAKVLEKANEGVSFWESKDVGCRQKIIIIILLKLFQLGIIYIWLQLDEAKGRSVTFWLHLYF